MEETLKNMSTPILRKLSRLELLYIDKKSSCKFHLNPVFFFRLNLNFKQAVKIK
jgi:hypothetical protein